MPVFRHATHTLCGFPGRALSKRRQVVAMSAGLEAHTTAGLETGATIRQNLNLAKN